MGAGFNPELSGTDNILFNGAMLGFSRKQMLEKVDGIYEFTGLREFAEMPLKYYSSGMYMRLAFAIATEVHPDILLIDEALGVGDAAFLDKAKARLRSVVERSKALVLVSHNLDSLRELCTRGLWIQHGQLVADGPIDEVIARYRRWSAEQSHASACADPSSGRSTDPGSRPGLERRGRRSGLTFGRLIVMIAGPIPDGGTR
jgi:ABC-type polysaccharide/polyol phosphate transport system ATPase subunit